MFADIIIDIKHEKLDRIFQYRIPESLQEELRPGMEVLVPFGKGNRITKGYVTGISEICDYDLSKVKEIRDISRTGVAIEGKLVALAAWMKENYGGTMIQALKTGGCGFSWMRRQGEKSLPFIWRRIRRPGPGFWLPFWMIRCWNMIW